MPGNIIFKPIEANLTRGTELLFRMNPYCSFSLGDKTFTGEVCKKGGKHPTWTDSISIPASDASTAKLELMDKELLTKDDIIGSCSLDLELITSKGSNSRDWFPLFFEGKPAGEILLETTLEGKGWETKSKSLNMKSESLSMGLKQEGELLSQSEALSSDLKMTALLGEITELSKEKMIIDQQDTFIETGPSKFFTEQRQTVEPRTFTKEVEVTNTVEVQKEIQVLEEFKVLKDVEYTEAVPVMKEIEVVEPVVIMKEIEVIEPRVVTKTIEVIENVPVKKMVEVVEMKHTTKQVETMEPQTFHKQVEVTEQRPVTKTVTVSEPVTTTKTVEYVQPVITTQTITKEIRPEVIVNQTVTAEVLPATVIGVTQETYITELQKEVVEERYREEKISSEMISGQKVFEEERTFGEVAKESEFLGEEAHEEKEAIAGFSKKSRKHNKKHSSDIKKDL